MKQMMLSACFLLVAGNALAADGTIHFTGSITDQTCTVDTGSQNLPVDLGNVAQTALNGAAGMKAAPTRFTLSLSDCPDTVTGANVKFDGTSDGVNRICWRWIAAPGSLPAWVSKLPTEMAPQSHCIRHRRITRWQKAPIRWTLSLAMSLPALRSQPARRTVPRSSPLTTNNAVPSRGTFLLPSYPVYRRITGNVSQGCVFFARR